jgi:hypothetical protein
MHGLLDTDLLDGPLETSTRLRPARYASPISSRVPDEFLAHVQDMCQYWAGSNWPLLPVDGDGAIPELYFDRLKYEAVDHVRDGIAVTLPRRVNQDYAWATPVVYPLSGKSRSGQRLAVEVVQLGDGDPWKDVYAAVLGSLPPSPSQELIKRHQLRPDLRFEELVDVNRVSAIGSLEDLAARLGDMASTTLTPRQLSCIYLASGMSPDSSFMGAPLIFPSKTSVRRAAGPNIIVVIAEGSIDDLCLWQWVPESPPPAVPVVPAARTNVVAIIGLVFGVLGLLAWWGFASWLAAAPFGLIAVVLGLVGDVLSRRGYAGKRMGVFAAVLGFVCLAPTAAALL